MRHRAKTHSFSRRQGPRIALIRGLVYSLVEHGRIKTTLAKAKEVRRHVEKAITLGKKGTLHSRRLLESRYPNPAVVELLSTDLKDRFANRAGGYTRIIKIGSRAGDASPVAFIEFVDFEGKTAAPEAAEDKKSSKKASAKKTAAKKTASKKKVTKKPTTEKAKKKVRKKQSSARKKTRSKKS
jgi:large subunit ribosomal protein L17